MSQQAPRTSTPFMDRALALTSMVVASIILNEQVTTVSILGGAVILVGIWLVNRKG